MEGSPSVREQGRQVFDDGELSYLFFPRDPSLLTIIVLVQLRTDMALAQDKGFKPTAQLYAKDEEKFFSDFSKVFSK